MRPLERRTSGSRSFNSAGSSAIMSRAELTTLSAFLMSCAARSNSSSVGHRVRRPERTASSRRWVACSDIRQRASARRANDLNVA